MCDCDTIIICEPTCCCCWCCCWSKLVLLSDLASSFRPALPTEASFSRAESVAATFEAIADAPTADAAIEVVVTLVAIGIFCAFCGASGMCVWTCWWESSPPWSLLLRCCSFSAFAAALAASFELDLDEISFEEDFAVDDTADPDDDFAPESSFFRPDSLIFAPGMAVVVVVVGCPLSRLRLESLRSLRADEKPLLELVRFEICDFWAARSCFSLLLNSLNLSSIECFWWFWAGLVGMFVTLPWGSSVMVLLLLLW